VIQQELHQTSHVPEWLFFCAVDRSSLSIQASNQSTQITKIVSKTLCADIFSHYLVPQILDHQSLTLCADVMMSHPQVTGWVSMFKSLTDTKLVG
jgi:hypothetical protein